MLWLFAAVAPSASDPSGSPTVFVVAAIVGGIFGTGGIAAFLSARTQNKKLDAETIKTRAEADVLPIDLAKGAVVVQADVIKDLREELLRQDRKIDEQAKIIENARVGEESAAARAAEAYRKLDEKCSKLQSDYADLLARFEAALRERDSWRTKANGAS